MEIRQESERSKNASRVRFHPVAPSFSSLSGALGVRVEDGKSGDAEEIALW